MRKPRGFREGHDGSLACPHRDVSVCPTCVTKHAEIIDVYGRHFWVADPAERKQLLADMATAKKDASK